MAVRVSALAFVVLTERLEIRVPSAVRLVPDGFGPKHLTDTVAELNRLGLLDERGDVEERLAGRLRILDQASRVVNVVAHMGGTVNAVLAATERRATLIIHSGQDVVIRKAMPQGLGVQAAGLLPDVPAGYGRSVSVLTETLRKAAAEAGDDTRALESALRRRGVVRASAHMIAVMNEAAVHTAQFGVMTGDHAGRHQRVIGWWRNESGGYLTEEHFSSSGESWTTIAPADVIRLAGQIDTALARHETVVRPR